MNAMALLALKTLRNDYSRKKYAGETKIKTGKATTEMLPSNLSHIFASGSVIR